MMLVLAILFGYMIYELNFSRKIETRKYIDKIVELKIDSCRVEKFSNHISYEFFVDNKYLVSIDTIKFVPFKSKAKLYICVKDIAGNIVVSNWGGSYWQSDMDKFMRYFKVYLIQKQ